MEDPLVPLFRVHAQLETSGLLEQLRPTRRFAPQSSLFERLDLPVPKDLEADSAHEAACSTDFSGTFLRQSAIHNNVQHYNSHLIDLKLNGEILVDGLENLLREVGEGLICFQLVYIASKNRPVVFALRGKVRVTVCSDDG